MLTPAPRALRAGTQTLDPGARRRSTLAFRNHSPPSALLLAWRHGTSRCTHARIDACAHAFIRTNPCASGMHTCAHPHHAQVWEATAGAFSRAIFPAEAVRSAGISLPAGGHFTGTRPLHTHAHIHIHIHHTAGGLFTPVASSQAAWACCTLWLSRCRLRRPPRRRLGCKRMCSNRRGTRLRAHWPTSCSMAHSNQCGRRSLIGSPTWSPSVS